MKANLCVAAAFLLCVIGCGRSERPAGAPVATADHALKKAAAPPAVQASESGVVAGLTPSGQLAEEFVFQEAPAGGGKDGKGQDKPAIKIARKIRHTADLKLIADEFDKTRDELQKLIEKHQGYEAMADIRSSPGAQRVGTWRVRVPIENFSAFRDAARKLAEVESDTVNTEDLTDQYYDLEANIKNLKAEQDSWRDMLKRTSDKLENLISVKRELDRVTDEIQRKEGRLRLMANLTDLTTVHLVLRERQKFNPDKGPDATEVATFGMKAGKTLDSSWGALLGFGQALALFAIALAPWLPLILLVGLPCWYFVRRVYRGMPTANAPAAPTAAT